MMNTDQVRADDILNAFEKISHQVKILSLDCFDTLLWRKSATPTELFNELSNNETYKSLGYNGPMRALAEVRARNLINFKRNTHELNLFDIYQNGFTALDKQVIEKLIHEEIKSDLNNLYYFPPFAELIKKCNKLQIKIIIVSDTYYSKNQLQYILSNVLPIDIYNSIYKVYCSSEYEKSKSNGLFLNILQELNCAPESILHVGDNLIADYVIPKSCKINCLHFIKYDEEIIEMHRLQETAAKVINSEISNSIPLYHPFQPIFAMKRFSATRSHELIGYASLGPIMYAFADYLANELRALEIQGKKPKLLFIMRDGYLPLQSFREFKGESLGAAVHISRFAAYAASFRTLEDIESYLLDNAQTNRYYDLAKQLLLPDSLANEIASIALKSDNPAHTFYMYVSQADTQKIIFKNSKQFRDRLLRHLSNNVNMMPGETFVFVDLGYSGTAQRRLTAVLNEVGIEVTGRYLVSLDFPGHEKVQKGLIDPSWCDSRAIKALVYYISWFEQLCTSNERSVLDYDENGVPIGSKVRMNDNQHEKLKMIQTECLRFIHDAKHFFQQSHLEIDKLILRQFALTELARLIYLPTNTELQYLQSFEAEMNLGTNNVMPLFNTEKGLAGLRRKSLFYMEKPSELTRTNYTAELRTAGMEWAITHLVEHRFGFRLNANDMSVRKEVIPVEFRQGSESFATTTLAMFTYEGYLTVMVPTNMQLSIMLGVSYKWVQIECVELIPLEHFAQPNESQYIIDGSQHISFTNAIEHSAGLYELADHGSAINLAPIGSQATNSFVLRLVFRPLMRRLAINQDVKSFFDKITTMPA